MSAHGTHTLNEEQQDEMRTMYGVRYHTVQTGTHGALAITLSDKTVIPNNRANRRRLRVEKGR